MAFGTGLIEGGDCEADVKDTEEWRIGPARHELAFSAREDDKVVAVGINRSAENGFYAQVINGEEVGIAGILNLSHGVDIVVSEHACE